MFDATFRHAERTIEDQLKGGNCPAQLNRLEVRVHKSAVTGCLLLIALAEYVNAGHRVSYSAGAVVAVEALEAALNAVRRTKAYIVGEHKTH